MPEPQDSGTAGAADAAPLPGEVCTAILAHMLNGVVYGQLLFKAGVPDDFIYLQTNPAFHALTGLGEVQGRRASECLPDLRAAELQLLPSCGRVVAGGAPEQFEAFVPALQHWFSVQVYSPGAAHFVAILELITPRRQSEEQARQQTLQTENALRLSEKRYRTAFQTSLDAININRLSDGLYIDVNQAFLDLLGYERPEVIGRTSLELNIWTDPADRQKLVQALQRDGRCPNLEARFTKKSGQVAWGLMSATVTEFDGQPCILSVTRDITERRQAADRIQYLAHCDALTGLPNRAQLDERAREALRLVKRSGEPLALMFLDLDHFKDINDTLGHSAGDALLVELARRLSQTVRETDTVARLGGDEFIFLLHGTHAQGAAHVARKLLKVIAQPCQIDQEDLSVSGSIGIALYPEDGTDLETLFKRADTAMYRAKQEGRNGYSFFTAEMQAQAARNLQLLNALRHALERKQLHVHYQPQLALREQRIVGAEALLRWTHPEFGPVAPAEFIPVAEDSGLILPIGEWVLRQAVQQARHWQQQGLGPLVMAVNLSAVQFRHPDLPALVTRILDEAGLPAPSLELELTESVAMGNPQNAIAVMDQLHRRGVGMSIDDFGTGYASLSYLKKFKIGKLKIDQSFVQDIGNDPEDKAIVKAIIQIAKSLGLQTIAEGVETAGQMAYLREQDCDEIQGYIASKPLPASEFEAFVHDFCALPSA
jgi:diguanylate cyclase (GGDEF)-like protein/PAS domain S-box-containing protein